MKLGNAQEISASDLLPSNKPPALEIRNLQYDEDDWKEDTDLIFVQES